MERQFYMFLVIGLFCAWIAAAPIDDISPEFVDEDSLEGDSSEKSDMNYPPFINVQAEDGNWHTINMSDTLEHDDLYDFPNRIELDVTAEENKVKNKNVYPRLYTHDDPDVAHELTPVNGRDAPFDINHPTKVVIHGWLNNGGQGWVLKMKDKFFINGNYNVILVDWHRYALLEYTIAARKTRIVASYLAEVLLSLIVANKIRPEDIHLAGHSLGAHVAGVTGKIIQSQIGKKIGRITGLDPAGPLFETPILCSKKKRLTMDDANFVDVIHTDIGRLGFKQIVGHADFFPNAGKRQPGCTLKTDICDHLRSYEYFTESINTVKFLSTSCDSWSHYKKGKCKQNERLSMGHNLDTTKASGKYYLRTRRHTPFALG